MQTVYAMAAQRLPPLPGRPWALPLPVRVLIVLIHLRTNLTTRALAALFHTSQSTWTASSITHEYDPPGTAFKSSSKAPMITGHLLAAVASFSCGPAVPVG